MSKINVRSFSNENEDGAPDLVGITTFSATSYFVPTRGTTAQRPSDHVEVGSLRYNTDTRNLEYYRGKTIGWNSFELIDLGINDISMEVVGDSEEELFKFNHFKPSIIFLLLPDVDNTNKKSFSLQSASTCFEKIYSNPKSFAIDVITDVSVVKAIPGIGNLFLSLIHI